MNKIKFLTPTRQGILVGAGVRIATKNIAIGIILIIMFSIVSNIKLIKK